MIEWKQDPGFSHCNMPLYEYKCHRCDKVFEVRQKFSDAPLTMHEGCGGEVERLLSAPALQFKGSGWYVTDYGRGKSPSKASNGHSASESKPAEKKETKTEAKPASTAAEKKV